MHWIKVCAVAPALVVALVNTVPGLAQSGNQKPTLRQAQRQSANEQLDKFSSIGFCIGFFDIQGNAGETLELSGHIPQADAQRFLRRTALDRMQIEGMLPALGDMFDALAPNEAFSQKLQNAYRNGITRGKKASDTADKSTVITWYDACAKESNPPAPPPPVAQQAGPPKDGKPPEPPSRAPAPPKQSVDSMIDDILKNRQSQHKSQTPEQAPRPVQQVTRQAPAAPNLAAVVTASEIEGVLQKIRPCWNTQGGSRDQAMIISFTVEMSQNGTPVKAEVRDTGRYNSDPVYRAAADAAYRAIMHPRCQPWPLSPEKFTSWKTLTFNFNPRDY